MYECKCGKACKNKAGMMSHAKACAMVKAFPDGIWEVLRRGTYRLLFRW